MTFPPNADDGAAITLPDTLPVLPLRDTVIFPYAIAPLSIDVETGTRAVDQALADHRLVMLVAQRGAEAEPTEATELHRVGTVGMILRMLRLPDGRVRVLIQGLQRARVEHFGDPEPYWSAHIEGLESAVVPERTPEIQATERHIVDGLERAAHLGRAISSEVLVVAASLEDPGRLADLVANNLELKVEEAQPLLENLDPIERLDTVRHHLDRELHLLTLQDDMASQARHELDRTQREYVLRQQMRAIQEELGEVDDFQAEIELHRKAAQDKKLPEDAVHELEVQIRRLERSHPDSAETTVIRTYLDWLTGMPWGTLSEDDLDLEGARAVLDADHYGLERVKERILEMLAVRRLKPDARGPILCLVGPPGVGKTSLGRSIARALGRTFVRVSLGGIRDEAEIRGHRRTYVGAMPGRILQGIHQAGTSNPVFMLDEIDKVGADHRGDPSSALLEVLDPEQNDSFRDHYLGLPYDLSRTLFITTANQLDPIQPAFRDRLEVIRLSGYTEEEKLAITKRHLLPRQREAHGLADDQLRLTDAGIAALIRGYTRESGLRNLERELAAVCRKVAVTVVAGKPRRTTIGPRDMPRLLGPVRHLDEPRVDEDLTGLATGLAWTAHGGELLLVEVATVPGKGRLKLTGQLGDVMQESAQAALTYARSYAERFGIGTEAFDDRDIHLHVPSGAVPKDGPSAGITMATALLSVLTGRAVDRTIAMTGELTLRGLVLPIGGLKEKALAARTAGLKTVVIPADNEHELGELPKAVRRALRFVPCRHMDDVAAIALAEVRGDDRDNEGN